MWPQDQNIFLIEFVKCNNSVEASNTVVQLALKRETCLLKIKKVIECSK